MIGPPARPPRVSGAPAPPHPPAPACQIATESPSPAPPYLQRQQDQVKPATPPSPPVTSRHTWDERPPKPAQSPQQSPQPATALSPSSFPRPHSRGDGRPGRPLEELFSTRKQNAVSLIPPCILITHDRQRLRCLPCPQRCNPPRKAQPRSHRQRFPIRNIKDLQLVVARICFSGRRHLPP